MTTIAELAVKLTGDVSSFNSAMNGAQTTSKNTAANISKNLKNIGSDLTQMGQTATTYLTLPILGVGAASLKMASDLNETKNKTKIIFGDMTQSVLDWSTTSATALGQSQQQALDNVSGMALWAKQAGLAGNSSVKFAESNVQLASDMASFFNTSPQDALDAIQSAYEGMTRPIRAYNVLLDQNSIQQQAMKMGLIKAGDPLTTQARILAVNALILAQTSEAQGDFARTSDQLANSTRIAQAQLANAGATLGNQLLPYALQFVHWASDMLTKFQALTPAQQKWIVIILGVVAAIGPLLIIVGSLVTAIGAIIPVAAAVGGVLLGPIGIAIAVVIGLVALLYLAWKNNWGGIQQLTALYFGAMKNSFNILVGVWNGLWGAMQAIWAWMSTVLFPFWQAVGNFIGAVFGLEVRVLAGIWQNVLAPALQAVWNWLSPKLMPAFTAISNFWNSTLFPVVKAIASWIGGNVVGAFQSLTNTLSTVKDWLNKIADTLNNLSLPSWMTPGSPTPWEIGLMGVRRELESLGSMALPGLQANLTMLPMPALASTSAGGGNNGNYYQIYGGNWTIGKNGQPTSGDLLAQFENR